MSEKPLLKEHRNLLQLIALGASTKSRGDGWSHENWVSVKHSNLVKKMKTNGWPPLVNLANDLSNSGLLEQDSSRQGIVRVTDAGRDFLNGGSIKVRQQVHPPLDLKNLHPEVQKIAGALVSDGHYRQAITDVFIGLDSYVKAKSELSDDGATLMQKTFSQNKPILELSQNSEEQAGFMMLFTGAMKAIRNQYAHSLINPKDKEETLEWLGFGSALFRLVDNAKKN